jgi:antitoxin VapB
MSLNLKNPEAERLAKTLAQETGESLTGAVIVALKERLERRRASAGNYDRLARMKAIAKRTAAHIQDPRPSQELFDELYDEAGLPK